MSAAQKQQSFVRRHPWLTLLGATLLLILAWLVFLDLKVTAKFDGRRWDLPAQVYARPLELYVGLKLPAARLERELRRLGYRRSAQVPDEAGYFYRSRSRIDLVTREFQFFNALQPATRLSVQFTGERISALRDRPGPDGRNVAIARLDPLLVGSIFANHGEDRLIVSPSQTPALLGDALKAVEDRRFDSHYGVDPRALARAIFVNVSSGELTQGGSTLTQQLVKNYFLDNRRTLWRKLREAAMAIILDWHYEKDDLLNAYINEIYMGQDGARAIHGFGLASQYYFSRPLAEIDLHQLALLVAMVKGPTYFNPERFTERAILRRNLVLQVLAETGVVEAAAAEQAKLKPLDTWDRKSAGSSYYPAFLQLVRQQLGEQYQDDDLTREGLRIFTSLDPLAQTIAEQGLQDGLQKLDTRVAAEGRNLAGAVVISNAQSGEVVAIVGDRNTGFDGFNRALSARRPIGSLVKPAVYLAALQTGNYSLASLIDDAPITVDLANNSTWSPQNYDGEAHGEVTLLRALVESFNLSTVRLGLEVGVERVASTLSSLGAPEKIEPYPSLLLGAVEMTPFEVTQWYSTLANEGFKTPLRAVRSVLNAQGEPLQRYPMKIEQAADPAAVYQLNQGLMAALARGTGRSARLADNLLAAGKTGTSDEYRDSWFAGFTGEHVMVVWVGYDDNQPTRLTGASGALTVWASIINELPTSDYAPVVPEGVQSFWVDYETGLLARPGCADVVELALSSNVRIGRKPGCGPGLQDLGRRALQWFEELVE